MVAKPNLFALRSVHVKMQGFHDWTLSMSIFSYNDVSFHENVCLHFLSVLSFLRFCQYRHCSFSRNRYSLRYIGFIVFQNILCVDIMTYTMHIIYVCDPLWVNRVFEIFAILFLWAEDTLIRKQSHTPFYKHFFDTCSKNENVEIFNFRNG